MITAKNVEYAINELTLAAKVWGDSKHPPLLAIHGWLDNAASFDFIAPLLAESHYVVAVDLIGHGRSSHRSSGAYYIWDYVRELIQLVEQLNWDQFSVIGHSMGTTVAFLLAAIGEDKVRNLLCIEGFGPITTPAEATAQQFIHAVKEFQKSLKKNQKPVYQNKEDMVLMRKKGFSGEISYAAAKALVERSAEEIPGGFTWTSDWRLKLPSFVRFTEEQFASFFKLIKIPVSVILAEQGIFSHQPFNDPKYQIRRDFVPNLHVEYLPGGHHLHMEEQAHNVAMLCKKLMGSCLITSR